MSRYPEPWGICQRSGNRLPLSKLRRDGQTGLLVDPRWWDPRHPQERPAIVKDDVGIRGVMSPENFVDQVPATDANAVTIGFPQYNSRESKFEAGQFLTVRQGLTLSDADQAALNNWDYGSGAVTYGIPDSQVDPDFCGIVGAPAGDAIPAAFSFTPADHVDSSTLVTSETITITGLTAETTIGVDNGEYSLNGAPFTSTNGMIAPGDELTVRHTSAPGPGEVVTTTVVIGGISGAFVSTTTYIYTADVYEAEVYL